MLNEEGMLVASDIDGALIHIPLPKVLPLYDVDTIVTYEIDNKEYSGIIIGLSFSAFRDAEGRYMDECVYTIRRDGSKKIDEVLEKEITYYTPETNSLSPEYYKKD